MRKSCIISVVSCCTQLAALVFMPALPVHGEDNRLKLDFRGEAHYSEYNFTDVVQPYEATDAWAELRIAYWLNEKGSLSPYLSIVPVGTTESSFWWQRTVQTEVGVQWYPFSKPPLQSIRLFVGIASRRYYDEPDHAAVQRADTILGGDYYHDNLYNGDGFFTREPTLSITWTSLAFRRTNFSQSDYKALLWAGNVKVGRNLRHGRSVFMPYVVADWCYVPKHDERWWENYLRAGAGVRWYPTTSRAGGFPAGDLARRSYVYAEILNNAAWLGVRPSSGDIATTDFRLGVGFSTGGFLRE